jgi:PAS domain S-box-containing protein
VDTERTGTLTPELSQTAGDPLRRLAQLNVAVVAISTALVVLIAFGIPGNVEPAVFAAASGAVLAVVACLLLVSWRLARRELDERRHTERVLRESESVFRQLGESVREVFYLCEWPSGGLIFVSPAFARVWGRPPGEAFSFKVAHPATFRLQWIDEIDPRDRERIQRLWATRAAHGGFDAEYRITRADGEERWIHDRAFPVSDGNGRVVRIAGIAEDITERTRGELRSRDLIEAAPDAMVIIDVSGQILLVNAQTEKLFGYERAELMGAPVEMLLPERYRERHREHRAAFVAAPRVRPMGMGIDLYALRKSGEEFPVEISLAPLETDQGRFVSAAIRDITEVRYAQRELARQRDALEVANQDLARSNSELEQFASVASHDLQEPLRKLVSFSELLRSDLGGELPERAAQDLEFITDAARRMRTLVRDLLTLSRTGTSEMKVRTVSLDDCLDRVLEALDLRITETRAVITRDALPEVSGDATLLGELLQNLVSNALKFVPPGGTPRIHVSAEIANDDSWVIGVRDEGIGIDPERAHEIFRPFRRLHSTDKYPGTGIGLAIARKAVDRHGGRLWVESAKGSGSHFRFTLGGAARRAS